MRENSLISENRSATAPVLPLPHTRTAGEVEMGTA
jgi:hypothetical protein